MRHKILLLSEAHMLWGSLSHSSRCWEHWHPLRGMGETLRTVRDWYRDGDWSWELPWFPKTVLFYFWALFSLRVNPRFCSRWLLLLAAANSPNQGETGLRPKSSALGTGYKPRTLRVKQVLLQEDLGSWVKVKRRDKKEAHRGIRKGQADNTQPNKQGCSDLPAAGLGRPGNRVEAASGGAVTLHHWRRQTRTDTAPAHRGEAAGGKTRGQGWQCSLCPSVPDPLPAFPAASPLCTHAHEELEQGAHSGRREAKGKWKEWSFPESPCCKDHLMRRADSLEKTLMLGKIGGGRRRDRQRMRWLGGSTDSMDMSLSELRALVMDMEARRAAVHGHDLSNWTELNWESPFSASAFFMSVHYNSV